MWIWVSRTLDGGGFGFTVLSGVVGILWTGVADAVDEGVDEAVVVTDGVGNVTFGFVVATVTEGMGELFAVDVSGFTSLPCPRWDMTTRTMPTIASIAAMGST